MNKLIVLICILSMHVQLFAQKSTISTHVDKPLKEAIQFVERYQYQQAYIVLHDYCTQWQQHHTASKEITQAKAEYYFLLCALKLEKPDAVNNMLMLLKQTPCEYIKKLAQFDLATYSFSKNDFESAIRYYESTGINFLSNEQLVQRNFELGYAYLVTQRIDKVEPFFNSAKSIPGDYFKPGNYYHGLLSYYKKEYVAAEASFNAVKEDPRYEKIVPFYLTEIKYLKGDKQQALSEALQYVQAKEKLYYHNELNLMIAHMYAEQQEFAKAEPYYASYLANTESVRREDYFKLGYSQYKQAKYTEAIANFELVSKPSDEMFRQTQMLLANAYAQTNDKKKLMSLMNNLDTTTFDAATKCWYVHTLSLLHYERTDYDKALRLMQIFVEEYPSSEYAESLNEMISLLFIENGEFNEAATAMNRMKDIPEKLIRIYQKAIYRKGLEMVQQDEVEKAMVYFDEARKFSFDLSIPSLSLFWLSEATYRLGQYPESFEYSYRFLEQADTIAYPHLTKVAHLNKAYALLQSADTLGMLAEYRKYISNDTIVLDTMALVSAQKPKFNPEELPAKETYQVMPTYHFPDEDISLVYTSVPLKPLALQSEKKRVDQSDYVQVKAGFPMAMDLKAGINLDPVVKMPLYVDVSRSSMSAQANQREVGNTHVGVHTTTSAYQHAIDASLQVDRNKQYYYGVQQNPWLYNERKFVKHVYTNVGMAANIIPLEKNDYDIHYKADVYTGLYTNKADAGEYTFKIETPVSKKYNESTTLQADVLADINLYFLKGSGMQNNSAIVLRPAIVKRLANFTIKTGLYPVMAKSFHLLPDVKVSYPVLDEKLILEAACLSTIGMNTFKQLSTLNPFIFDNYTPKQSVNTEYTLGAKGNLLSNASYAVRSGMAVYNNLPLFMNDIQFATQQFEVLYLSRATAFILDASIEYTLHTGMFAGARINLHPLVQSSQARQAWAYMPFSFELYSRVQTIKNLSLGTDIFIMPGTSAMAITDVPPYPIKLKPAIDVNVNARYAIRKNWNILLDINNLLNSKYQRWAAYPMFGTQLLAGVSYSFKSKDVFKQ
ncbi:MAG: tetratricopeptide repeat protein [Bacteroidetes bacterium]|nr:tetratricopeptide repeat protein [Bacteroidota bacterium]